MGRLTDYFDYIDRKCKPVGEELLRYSHLSIEKWVEDARKERQKSLGSKKLETE